MQKINDVEFVSVAKFEESSPICRVFSASKDGKEVCMVYLVSGMEVLCDFRDPDQKVTVKDESCRFGEYMLVYASDVINRVLDHEGLALR